MSKDPTLESEEESLNTQLPELKDYLVTAKVGQFYDKLVKSGLTHR